MSLVEGEVDLQIVNNVIDEEGEFQRQPREETEQHEEFLEVRSREWGEERSSPSFELRSASPKSPSSFRIHRMPVRTFPSSIQYLYRFLAILSRSWAIPTRG